MSKNNKKDFIYSKNPKNSMRVEKQKNPKKNKTAMIFLWLLFAFWTLGTVLSLFTFSKDLIEVKADSVTKLYTFEGSNMTVYGRMFNLYYVNPNNSRDYLPTTDFSLGTSPNYFPAFKDENCLVNYRFTLSDVNYTTDSGTTYSTELIFTASYNQFSSKQLDCYAYGSNSYNPSYVDETTDKRYSIVLGKNNLISYYMCTSILGFNQFLRITRSSFDFNCDIVRVDMVAYKDKLLPAYWIVGGEAKPDLFTVYFNFIRYFDSNDNYLEIAIPVYSFTGVSNMEGYFQELLLNRSYLLSNNISNSSIYNLAKKEGYSKGYDNGYKTGLNDGYISGVDSGYNEGYQAGVIASDNFTWLGLMTTVIEAPVRALLGSKDDFGDYDSGLFSIEILGVNLSNFFAGIFTLTLLITLVRLILRRG